MSLSPKVSENPSLQEIQDWQMLEPKNYQIRVLEPIAKPINQFIGKSDRLWRDLDGAKRPYSAETFAQGHDSSTLPYCMAILRKSWTRKKLTTALGRRAREPVLGHCCSIYGKEKKKHAAAVCAGAWAKYEALLEGAMNDSSDEEEASFAALGASNDQIKVSVKGEGELSYEQGSSSDDEADWM